MHCCELLTSNNIIETVLFGIALRNPFFMRLCHSRWKGLKTNISSEVSRGQSKLNKLIILPHTRLGTIHYCSCEVSSHAHQNQRVEFHQVLQNIDVKNMIMMSKLACLKSEAFKNCLQWLGNNFKLVHQKL